MSEPKVFIVDDNTAVAASQAALISLMGIKCKVFPSGEEFLENCQPPVDSCVVLDMRLEGMSGLEVQAAMLERHWDQPIIFCSGHAQGELGQIALDNGAFAFLEKPYEFRDLQDAVRKALESVGCPVASSTAPAAS